jgi:hypothetical protein
VTAVLVGTDSMDVLRENIGLLSNFTPFTSERMNELHVALDPFYNNKSLPWLHPAYRDGIA